MRLAVQRSPEGDPAQGCQVTPLYTLRCPFLTPPPAHALHMGLGYWCLRTAGLENADADNLCGILHHEGLMQ